MKRAHPSILVILFTALVIGVSISAGPVAWAMFAMIGPLVLLMVFTTRGVAHAKGAPLTVTTNAAILRASHVHQRERIARARAHEYEYAHLFD